ncbi:MAG: hypothetical protein OEV45_15375 [Desulfobacteraceae bacterium]|nr:hypothetical protein [Desulfobacteraceae bacterium]
MSTETKIQLQKCFDLLAKIQAEYPNGEFGREMIHGDMDFRFKRIKEMRDELETFPDAVHKFTRFIDAIHVPEKTVKSIFQRTLKEPERFSILKGLSFLERRKMIERWATEFETSAGNINELLTRARLAGILDDKYILKTKYQEVANAFLEL